jgi:hypothetical protein
MYDVDELIGKENISSTHQVQQVQALKAAP